MAKNYITVTTDVDVDIDIRDLDVDALIEALEAKEKSGTDFDKKSIAKFKKTDAPKISSLADQIKLEAFFKGMENKTINEIETFFS